MKTIIANLKMNKTYDETKQYLSTIVTQYNEKNEVVLALPYTSLALGKFLLEGKGNLKLASQNICDEERDQNTGEISGEMLRSVGVEYVIVGHSDRREKYKENGKTINKKIKIALKNAMGVILCIGENELEKKNKKEEVVLKSQIEEALSGLYENELEKVIIAYEPIWAIGTGKSAALRDVENAVKAIRKTIKDDFSLNASESIKIVYGGSANTRNANLFCGCNGVDGLLIGKESLDEDKFLKLLSTISK